jgi:hypothetical protein
MSKIKEQMERNQEKQLDELERENSFPKCKEILSNKIIKVANNKNYLPLQGA